MTADAKPDPRWRPFRHAALGVYLVFSIVFSVLVTYSVFKSVLEMTPSRPKAGPVVYTVEQCTQGAAAFFQELEAQRASQADGPAAMADHRFLDFRIDWLTRKARLEQGCGTDRPDRTDLKALFRVLDRLVDLYTTESVQFASSIGLAVDELHRILGRLERQRGTPQGAARSTQ